MRSTLANAAGGVNFCCIGRFEFDSKASLTLCSLPAGVIINASLPFSLLQTSKNQIKVDLVDENFTELKGEIAGPPDTPYEGDSDTLLTWTWSHKFIMC